MFKNKIVIITGSTQGIGYKLAEIICEKGGKVVINSRSSDKVERAVAQLSKKYDVFGVSGDVSEMEFCEELKNKVLQKYNRIDFLINNAAIAVQGKFSTTKAEVFKQAYNINVLGSVYPTLAIMDELKKNKGGVLFISSVASVVGLPSYSIYSSTKRALTSLAESLKVELKGDDIYIGINYPGFTENDPEKKIMTEDGIVVTLKKRNNVKINPVNKTVENIIRQIEDKKFKKYGSGKGLLFNGLYRVSPSFSVYLLTKLRNRIYRSLEN